MNSLSRVNENQIVLFGIVERVGRFKSKMKVTVPLSTMNAKEDNLILVDSIKQNFYLKNSSVFFIFVFLKKKKKDEIKKIIN